MNSPSNSASPSTTAAPSFPTPLPPHLVKAAATCLSVLFQSRYEILSLTTIPQSRRHRQMALAYFQRLSDGQHSLEYLCSLPPSTLTRDQILCTAEQLSRLCMGISLLVPLS